MRYKKGDTVTGKILFSSDGKLVRGVVVAEDAGISRDAVIVELPNGNRCTMLESTIISCKR